MGVFGNKAPSSEVGYDSNGYPKDLNIQPGDINPVSDFTFELNTAGDGYIVVSYNNTSDDTVVIPNAYEGLPVVELGYSSLDSGWTGVTLTSVAIPNSIENIGMYALYGNSFPTVIIPGSVTAVSDGAFQSGQLTHVTFYGDVPVDLGDYIFYNNPGLTLRTILVSDAQLQAYKDIASTNLSVFPTAIYSLNSAPIVPIIFDASRYPSELNTTADDVNDEADFEYEWDSTNNGWKITDYVNSSDTDVVIPAGRSDGEYIVSVGYSAMSGYDLTSVAIPNSIKAIESYAFSYNQLTSIIIPSSVTTIEYAAFNNNLLTQSQAYIYSSATDNQTLVSYGGAATTAVIPSTTRAIAQYALSGSNLESVTFNDGLTSIGDASFQYNQLTSLALPSSVTYIGCAAFYGNSGLLQASDFTYTWNSSLCGWTVTGYTNATNKSVVIPNERGDKAPIVAIKDSAFKSKALTSVVLPNALKSIGNQAFYGNQITSLTIPSSVQTIGTYAFYSNQILSLVIPDSVTTLGDFSFYMNRLTTLTLSSNMTTIPKSAFGQNQLTSVVIPNTVTLINDSAFYANLLISVTIPGNVSTIGQFAFSNNKLTSVIIQDGVTTIGTGAFFNNEMTSLSMANSVESIGERAFNINQLPQSQAYIYASATDRTTLVSYGGASDDVVIPNGVTTIGARAVITFHGVNNRSVKTLTLPNSLTTISAEAFDYNGLTTVTIPGNVTTLGADAFSHNNALNVITFEGPVPTTIDYAPFYGWITGMYVGDNQYRVPSAYLSDYQAAASQLRLSTDYMVGY